MNGTSTDLAAELRRLLAMALARSSITGVALPDDAGITWMGKQAVCVANGRQ
jgi:hypothetical protein